MKVILSVFLLKFLHSSEDYDFRKDFDLLNEVHSLNQTVLQKLALLPLFRITKAYLDEPCENSPVTFKSCSAGNDPLTNKKSTPCSLCLCRPSDIPTYLRNKSPSTDLAKRLINTKNRNVWLRLGETLDKVQFDFYDLEENKEAWTGYKGEEARAAWSRLYGRDCSKVPEVLSGKTNSTCAEEVALYRAVSGLQSSVNCHVIDTIPRAEAIKWLGGKEELHKLSLEELRKQILEQKFQLHEQRDYSNNLRFLFSLLYVAVKKAQKNIVEKLSVLAEQMEVATDKKDLLTAAELVKKIKLVFLDKEDFVFKNKKELEETFKAMQGVLNCISCEKCKLWGKLQVCGIAVALSVLDGTEGVLSIEEIHWLVRTFIKTASSLDVFRAMVLPKRKGYMEFLFMWFAKTCAFLGERLDKRRIGTIIVLTVVMLKFHLF